MTFHHAGMLGEWRAKGSPCRAAGVVMAATGIQGHIMASLRHIADVVKDLDKAA
jgi:hypothetical protein